MRVYLEILSVDELDAEVTREVVIEMLRSTECFAPTPGMVYSRTLERSRERFHRQSFPRLSRELIESSKDADGFIDVTRAESAIAGHPLIRRYGLPPTCSTPFAVILAHEAAHPGSLPPRVPIDFSGRLKGLTFRGSRRALPAPAAQLEVAR